MKIERDVMVNTRDGIALATDVYRPEHGRPSAALLQRTPYDKHHNALYLHAATIDLVGAVEDGYAVVFQDCRGRFGSEGEWEPFIHESDDGYDAVEWVAAQPWCDGHVGVFGNSYQGNTALQAAVAAPPHLDAVFSYMGGALAPDGWVRTNGALELSFMFFWLARGAWETLRRTDLDDDTRQALTATLTAAAGRPRRVIDHLPVAEIPGLQPELVHFWEEWVDRQHASADWRPADVVDRIDAVRAPILHVSGFFDNFCVGHVALQQALAEHPDTRVREESRFILGPWDHEAYMSPRPSTAGEIDFGPTAPNGFPLNSRIARRWFDRWLREEDVPPASRPPVSFFESGSDRWISADTWPPPHERRELHLSSGGSANTRSGDGRLTWKPQEGSAPYDEFVYDPTDPVPTVGGRTLAPSLGPAGVADQRRVEEREDVLVYTTAALEEPLAVAGPVQVVLYVSSDCEDTDFTGKLVDLEPDGYCRNIAEGIARARYRDGLDHETFLTDGEIVEMTVPLLDVGHQFGRGHRLRLEISSSNFPRFDRNLNSRVQPARGKPSDVRVARQQVHHDADHPARLVLPIRSSED
jgi:putative CocE/NonD family hydrolase